MEAQGPDRKKKGKLLNSKSCFKFLTMRGLTRPARSSNTIATRKKIKNHPTQLAQEIRHSRKIAETNVQRKTTFSKAVNNHITLTIDMTAQNEAIHHVTLITQTALHSFIPYKK